LLKDAGAILAPINFACGYAQMQGVILEYPAPMKIEEQLAALQARLRSIRESQGLTLSQVAAKSNGRLSAIALGSYERGDRSISAHKLLEISNIYQVPVAEIFKAQEKSLETGRVIIDLRKLNNSSDDLSQRFKMVVEKIAAMRNDWNGELLSMRASDMASLHSFAGFSANELQDLITRFALAKLDPTKSR
jgi:transcriptional regulator with XRE-family HTH domain